MKTEAALIKGVVQHLRKIGGASTSAVKRIARETAKTAKRDITGLKSAGLIVYRGTRRIRFYELAHE
jgi:hypothetical protein